MSMKKTFWQLLDEHAISIPIIQRDYVQGRDDSKTNQIRTEFIADLFTMINDPKKSQDLDFIYGSVKDDHLILLDGQQRITTLFLLHWYIAIGTGNLTTAKSKLAKFKYENRVTSKEFTHSLLRFSDDIVIQEIEGRLSETLFDASWFFSVWKDDPTVKAMLVMLDEIHRVFKAALSPELWNMLICSEKPPVTFHFLNMDNFALTDELYIKMNARGQALTEFENLKAWLQGYVNRSEEICLAEDFWLKLDKSWTDVFWKMRPKGSTEVDDTYLRFFKTIALTQFVSTIEYASKKNEKEYESVVSQLRDNSYFGHSQYETLKCFSNTSLNNTYQFLDFIHDIQFNFDGETFIKYKVLKTFNEGINKNGYLEKVRFASLYIFVCINPFFKNINTLSHEDMKNLVHWLEVTERLINNTAYDSATDYVNAVNSLSSLANKLYSNVFTNLAKLENKDIQFFNELQREEEILKAQLIINDEQWLKAFKPYHEHSYFYGQIGFLLDSCKHESESSFCIDTFKRNANKASVLFSSEVLERKDYLLHRSLLTFGDYFVWQGRNKNFCKNVQSNARDRNENWRSVFNDKSHRQKLLFQLLDTLDEGHEIKGMEHLIENSKVTDWRKFIIDEPEVLKDCRKMCVRFDYDESGEIYLLCSQRMSGSHYGLYSYFIFLKLKNLIKDSRPELTSLLKHETNYDFVSGDNDVPSVHFKSWKNGDLFFYFNKTFTYELWQDDKEAIFEDDASTKALSKFSYEITGLKEMSV
ncbi:hypothetical protein MSP8886_02837 [Marinomonas spartinae]|uniref:GmrSD restriction endonucleases N-terminal domain-containing protein n=1 Tax=Marinomonas spartinae TaxID=1792290 RepID=A0A1A8TM95_9GAMM|nr:DUF262 domain-containing protein [Marinomonas spartinae]SBS33684.1 hypothetical protein MSP8886_02837 [Marinomonas spartinae]